MKVAVIGAGAVGLGLSSCLLASRANLHLQVRDPRAADTLRSDGLTRTGIFGNFHALAGSFTVGLDLEDLAEAEPETVLVCTKTTAADEVVESLAEAWPRLRSPVVVLCHNGWGSAEKFAARLPKERIFNATVTTGFRREGWNRVEITVHGDQIHIGSLFEQSGTRVAAICRAIASGGIPCEPSAAMEQDLWAKLLYNCALNPLAALLGVPYGVIGRDANYRSILEAVVREIFEVLAASGRQTRWASADEYLDFFFGELLPPTREHESSMLQDLRAGRPTEIDSLCGAVVTLAAKAGVSVPVNDALTILVRAGQRSA
ncbi:MAG: ketopantoate reductase family protein [Myxococcota bacterium]|nr:ketopantoate reductase family protein [Myxococcota bacterium]